MVTRKPVPQSANTAPENDFTSLPSQSENSLDQAQEHSTPQYGNDYNAFQGSREDLPESLRVGPADYTPRSSAEFRHSPEITNPYLTRDQAGNEYHNGTESSADAWGGYENQPPPPTKAPPPPPLSKDNAPVQQFSNLSINDQNSNPWQPALDAKPLPQHPSIPSMRHEDSGNGIWSTAQPPSRQPPNIPSNPPPILVTMPSEPESPAWDEDDNESPLGQSSSAQEIQPVAQEDHVWGDNEKQRLKENDALLVERAAQEEYLRREGAFDSGFQEDQPQASGVVESEGVESYYLPPAELPAEQAPALPPRNSVDENPPPQPPRPSVNTTNQSSTSLASPGTPGSFARQQKRETYEIKKISWHDVSAHQNPRTTPILVQNVNGPCPLLALVNALTLSTPAELNTPLVESLRTREQISLGLLLDAVIDELMSGRRGDPDMELPNVLDLHHFLLDLHTGMNVNPRYFPNLKAPPNLMDDSPTRLSHVHPTDREDATPGTFEETRETQLYSIFSIPLIHGWLPSKGSPAYEALFRSARSYEDVQNLQFREEELEDKLTTEGLSFEETATFEDIVTIKAFLQESATQLTPHGLDTIMKSMEPGTFAILFRNNHFSTLYRHPINHQLLQLVTDMGYAGHEEVVWESLTDINGEHCELFSGDFRLVGGASSTPQVEASGWTTVSRQGTRVPGSTSQHSSSISEQQLESSLVSQSADYESLGTGLGSPNTEQEDHDLALALQLQEEEEERQRATQARRRRETELSQQYIEQQANTGNNGINANVPVTSNRGGPNSRRGRISNAGMNDSRPIIPPRRTNTNPPLAATQVVDPEAGIDVPPPSYEQAATQRAYNPPSNHPAHPNSSPNAPSSRRTTSAYSATMGTMPVSPGSQNRRASAIGGIGGPRVTDPQMGGRGANGQQGQGPDKDCVVM